MHRRLAEPQPQAGQGLRARHCSRQSHSPGRLRHAPRPAACASRLSFQMASQAVIRVKSSAELAPRASARRLCKSEWQTFRNADLARAPAWKPPFQLLPDHPIRVSDAGRDGFLNKRRTRPSPRGWHAHSARAELRRRQADPPGHRHAHGDSPGMANLILMVTVYRSLISDRLRLPRPVKELSVARYLAMNLGPKLPSSTSPARSPAGDPKAGFQVVLPRWSVQQGELSRLNLAA